MGIFATTKPARRKPKTGSKQKAVVRAFASGATRDTDTSKLDFEGFLSPLVLQAFGAYMNFNRTLNNGDTRDSDSWQKGMPPEVYIKSGFRHFFDMWKFQRGLSIKEGIVWAACGLLFNVQGYLHDFLKANPDAVEKALAANEVLRAQRWGKTAKKPKRERASDDDL